MLRVLNGIKTSHQLIKLGFLQQSHSYQFSANIQPPLKSNADHDRIRKLAKDTNILYLKKNFETKKIIPDKNIKTKDEIGRDTNQNVILREMGNDCAQIPLKLLAYWFVNPNNKGPFWAELTRSTIDAMNHLILYATSHVPTGPSSKYPYGIDKIKNFVVMLPGALFFISGGLIIYDSIYQIVKNSIAIAEPLLSEVSSLPTLCIYLMSIIIETAVIFKNVTDTANLHEDRNAGLFKKLSAIQKKDPLLEAILFENLITFTSTMIPMIVSVIDVFLPTYSCAPWGSIIIGIIQWYLGYQLFTRNIPNLIGQGVELEVVNDIIAIIKTNPYVLNLTQPKGITTGTHKFRFSANISFNEDKIRKELMEDLEERFDRITFERRYDDREEELSELVGDMPSKILNEIRIQQYEMEKRISEKYPDCVDVHLEIDSEKVYDVPTDEYTKDHLNISTNININLLEEEIKHIVEGDFMFNEKKKKALKTRQTYPFLNSKDLHKNYDFLFTEVDLDYIDENLCCDEDFRFEMIKTHLEDNSTRVEQQQETDSD